MKSEKTEVDNVSETIYDEGEFNLMIEDKIREAVRQQLANNNEAASGGDMKLDQALIDQISSAVSHQLQATKIWPSSDEQSKPTQAVKHHALTLKQIGGAEPPIFDRRLNDSDRSANVWVSKLSSRIQILKALDPSALDLVLFEHAVTYLTGEAYTYACRARTQLGAKASWELFKPMFLRRFGVNMSSLVLYEQLQKIEQGGTSVSQFADSFEDALDVY